VSARRTVSVALEVKATEARKQIHGTADEVRKLEASVVAAGHGMDKMSDQAAQAGRASEKMAVGEREAKREAEALKRELGSLDRQIDATVLHLKALGREFAATGDKALLKNIAAERAMLRRLQQVRNDLTPAAPAAVGVNFGALSGLMTPLIATLVGAAVLAAPGIGAALGAVGAGGMVGGIVAAAQDGRVKDAFSGLAHRLGESFTASGRPFLGPLLHEISQLEATAGSGLRILEDGFSKLAPLVHPLAVGIDGFVEALGPGMHDAFEAAKPLIRALANELPKIAGAISDALSSMSEESDGAVMGLIAVSRTVEMLIRGGGRFIAWLSSVFEGVVQIGYAISVVLKGLMDTYSWVSRIPVLGLIFDRVAGGVADLNDKTSQLLTGLADAKNAGNDFSSSLQSTADTAAEAAKKVQDLADAVDDLLHKQLSWDEAQIRLRQGMRDLVKELTTGKRTLAENSAEGDKNREAIEEQIGKVLALAEAYRAQTGDIEGANRMRDIQLEKLRAELLHLGYNKQAVNDLIDAYKNIPAKAATEVTAPGLKDAQTRLKKVEDTLDRLDGRVIRSTVLVQEQHREDSRLYRRWGGITEHAATGTLRQAATFTPAAPARYAFAEPQTGGEAFVPKRGDYGRSMSILSQAAHWYGASVVPAMGSVRAGGTQTIVHEHRHTVILDGTGVLSSLRGDIDLNGGSTQSYLGRRR
jgi:hypothetical protein